MHVDDVPQALILRESAGLLQGSHSSVARALTANVGGRGFDPQWLPMYMATPDCCLSLFLC